MWEDVLAAPIDTERVVGAHATRAGVFLAQALNHANHHRERVCAIITGLGVEPPDIQAWEHAWMSADLGRALRVSPGAGRGGRRRAGRRVRRP